VFLRWWGVCVGRMTHEARLDVILQTYRAGVVYESDSLTQSIVVLRNASNKRFRKGRFLRASRTAEKGWATSVLKQLQDPKGALRLRRRYDDRVERPRISWYTVLQRIVQRNMLLPAAYNGTRSDAIGRNNKEVKECLSVKRSGKVSVALIGKELSESRREFRSNCRSN